MGRGRAACAPHRSDERTRSRSLFFTASLGTKDVIKNIIDAEDRGHPYSDQEIVEKLRNEHGIILARRTVAKYREELQILPARLRKRA